MAACYTPADSTPADHVTTLAIIAYMSTSDPSLAAAAASDLHQLYSAFDPPAIALLQHPLVSMAPSLHLVSA